MLTQNIPVNKKTVEQANIILKPNQDFSDSFQKEMFNLIFKYSVF